MQKGQPSVAKIENGPTPNVALRNLYELAEALPVPLSKVFQLTEANLSVVGEKTPEDAWQLAVEEIKKLTPQKQAWVGKVILMMLKDSTD